MNWIKGGWLTGFIGVMIFAGSLPATRAAVADFDPLFLTSARAIIAATLGAMLLIIGRQRRPALSDLFSLAITAAGVVVGFPLLTALALQQVSSAHSIVFLGLLPLCTAAFAVLRGGERLQPAFWLFAIVGGALVAGYALSNDSGGTMRSDLLMTAAVIVCGLGYAEGAKLTRRLGGWQVISWALLLSLPVMLPMAWFTVPPTFSQISTSAWMGFVYVSVFSMLIGFIFWYHGLAKGGIAAVGQLQLVQPFMALGLASLLLHESVSAMMLLITLGAVTCVIGAKRFAVR